MSAALSSSDSHAWARWQFGDWEALASDATGSGSAISLALKASALMQLKEGQGGHQAVTDALAAGCDRSLLARLLLSGASNAVANAHALMGNQDPATHCFEEALRLIPGPVDPILAARVRSDNEQRRLGLPVSLPPARAGCASLDDHAWIERGVVAAPDSVPLLIAAAEHAQRHGHHADAVRYWQRVASLDGLNMAPAHYERLEDAYRQLKGFPLGSSEEEALRGDVDKYRVLAHIHQQLQPRRYLEIGVQFGRSLALAACPAIGVDPMPMVSVALSSDVRLIRSTSDAFFAEQTDPLDLDPLDLVFIDGMHLFEFALRDFINTERFAGPNTLVLIDDILPGHPAQAARDRRTRAWTGDVWKLLPALRRYRPDLNLLLLDTHPTGLLCVSGFRRNQAGPSDVCGAMASIGTESDAPPADIVARTGVSPSLGPALGRLIARLREVRSSPDAGA